MESVVHVHLHVHVIEEESACVVFTGTGTYTSSSVCLCVWVGGWVGTHYTSSVISNVCHLNAVCKISWSHFANVCAVVNEWSSVYSQQSWEWLYYMDTLLSINHVQLQVLWVSAIVTSTWNLHMHCELTGGVLLCVCVYMCEFEPFLLAFKGTLWE